MYIHPYVSLFIKFRGVIIKDYKYRTDDNPSRVTEHRVWVTRRLKVHP